MSRLVPRTLRARLLFIVLLASVPAAALTFGAQIRNTRSAVAQYREISQHAAHAVVSAQQRTFELSRSLLVSLSRLPEIREQRPACPNVLAELRAANPFLTNIAVADADGHLVCSALPATPTTTATDEPWFRRVVRDHAFTVGDAQVGRLTRRHVFIFAQPVIEAGRVTAVLFAGFDLGWFDRLMTDSDLPEGATVTILDHDATVAWRSADLERWAGRRMPVQALLQAIAGQRRGTFDGPGVDGVRRFHVFAPWGGAGPNEKWIVIGFPQEQVYAAFMATLTWNILGLGGIALVIALATHQVAAAFVLRPVRRLVDQAGCVAAGDLTARVDPSGADEIAALGRSFNAMTRTLEERSRDHTQAETALAEAQSRLVQILQTIPLGVIVVGPGGAAYLVNRAARAIIGTAPTEAVCDRLALHDAATGQRLAGDACPMQRALAGEHVHLAAAEVAVEERRVPLEVWAAPVFDAVGRVGNAIVVLHDLTEQRALEAQYQQAQKMEAIGRLAGGVAHDFNNLLTVILGYADMLLDGDASVRVEAQSIRDAGERARTLTQQLLAFSRKQMLQPQIVDLNEQVQTLARMVQRLLGEDVDLSLTLAPEPAVVSVDPGQFDQIALNIVVNARDAMPDGGRLAIEISALRIADGLSLTPTLGPGDYVMVAFHDTGAGMDEATRARVFEPFFTTKERGKGTGLGLATVYGIVSQSGGTITVHSRPGRGTSFRIYFPAARGAPTAVAAGRPAAGRGGSERVLLVEDNDEVRQFATRVLRQRGYAVTSVNTGEEALALLDGRERAPDLLLTDIVLKGMNGRRIAALAREAHPGLRVLYMSGYADPGLAPDDPGAAFLQKPFTPAQLTASVRRTLDLAARA